MNDCNLLKKYYEKIKLINKINEQQNLQDFKIGIHRFGNFVILAKFDFKNPTKLKEKLIQQYNKKIIKKFAKKKMTIVHIESFDLTNEFDILISSKNYDFIDYLGQIQKLYVADNRISSLSFASSLKSLELLYISNCVNIQLEIS